MNIDSVCGYILISLYIISSDFEPMYYKNFDITIWLKMCDSVDSYEIKYKFFGKKNDCNRKSEVEKQIIAIMIIEMNYWS